MTLFVTCFHDCFLLGLFFDPEDGGNMLFRKVDGFFIGIPVMTSQNIEPFPDNNFKRSSDYRQGFDW
jgi:hypothetical protein